VSAEDVRGIVEGAFIDCASMVVAIALSAPPEGAVPDLVADLPGDVRGDVTVYSGGNWHVAVCREPEGARRRFGVAISYASAEEAVERARHACGVDLNVVTRARLAFYASVPVPESMSGNNRRAYYKAVSVHKVNVESPQLDIPCRWTTPDRMPHRHMWLWDTAFHALGLQHLSTGLAQDALRALFSKQREDGKLLLAVQPGRAATEEEDTQPPIAAWSICRQNERATNTDFLIEMYPKLIRYIEWFEAHRKNDNALYGWRIRADRDPVRGARGGESGMDNSPRFDAVTAITAVDLSSYMAAEYFALEKIARCIDKTPDISEWRARRLGIAERVNELLWDDEDCFYYDLDECGEFVAVKTTAGLMPLLGEIPDRDRAESLRMHLMNPNEFWAPFPAPSVSQDEPTYGYDMWRGPAWPNVNVLIYYGLMSYGFFQEARQLARATLNEIVRCYLRHGCLYEYYDSTASQFPPELPRKGGVGEQGGVGFGVVADLHWTAAAFVHLANELG
jgi:glycogen debranching enzyme